MVFLNEALKTLYINVSKSSVSWNTKVLQLLWEAWFVALVIVSKRYFWLFGTGAHVGLDHFVHYWYLEMKHINYFSTEYLFYFVVILNLQHAAKAYLFLNSAFGLPSSILVLWRKSTDSLTVTKRHDSNRGTLPHFVWWKWVLTYSIKFSSHFVWPRFAGGKAIYK